MTETMIPFTEDVLRQMMTRLLDELIAHGLLEFEQDEAGYEKAGDQFMELLREQGLVDDHNGIPWDDAWSCQAKTATCRFCWSRPARWTRTTRTCSASHLPYA